MQTLQAIWNFFQNEILGMAWLNRLIGSLLNACGLDTSEKIGGSIQFFIYDSVKIMVLLGVLILVISYIQSYFPPERTKKNTRPVSRGRRELSCRAARNSNPVLLLLLHSTVYGLHRRRPAAWRHLFLFDFLPYGRPRFSCSAHEYFRVEGRGRLRCSGACHCCCRWHSD